MPSDRTNVVSHQLESLASLLGSLQESNQFYRSRLIEAGLGGDLSSLTTFVEKCPFTTKMDLVWDREEYPPYGSNLTFPLSEYSRYCQSSGTTSGPLPSLDTHDSWSAMLDCWDRVYEAAGVEVSDIVFFAFSFGPFLGFWTAFEAATRRGNLAIPGGGLSSQARIQTLLAHEVEVLCCTPTYAIRLGEVLAEQSDSERAGMAIEKIIVAGEPGGSLPEVRSRLRALWGENIQIYDHHGMTEVGPVTYEHPDHSCNLCVIEDAYFAEIIDRETQLEVQPGERGELVLTTLTRTAAPLLRYRTGDIVEKSYFQPNTETEPILCLKGGILGRADEMVVIRGVNIYPTAVEKILRSFSEVAEFQVIQFTRDSMAELKISVEPQEGVEIKADLVQKIETALANAFTLRIPVSLTAAGALPRFEFKSKRWVQE